MGYFDYSKEPRSDIAFVDMKSFYASVECVERGLHPLKTSLCVMSRADNSAGLILASSPMFKKIFGKSNVGRSYDLPFEVRTFVKNKEFPMLQLNTGEDNPQGDPAFVLIPADDSIYPDKDMSDLKKDRLVYAYAVAQTQDISADYYFYR